MEMNAGAPLNPESLKVFETLPYHCLILTPDFQILNASNAYLKLVGRTRELIVGRNVYEVFYQNENWQRALDAGLQQSMEIAITTGKRHEMPVVQFLIPEDWDAPEPEPVESYWVISHSPVLNAAGEIAYFIHDINNITGQVNYEKRLRESLKMEQETTAKANLASHQMRRLFDEIPAQVGIVRGPELVYEYVNPAYQQEMLPGQELIGRRVIDVMPGVEGMPIWNILQQTYREGKFFVEPEIEIPLPGPDGHTLVSRFFNVVYQPLKDEQGQIGGILSFKYEVTSHVVARKQLQKRKQELVEVNARLSEAYEELLASNEEMVVTNEELETTNEQLHKAHESISRMNEELEERVRLRTQELQVLQEKAENESERLRFLLNAMPQQVWTTDPVGKLLAVNEVLCTALGHSVEEILEIGLPKFAHPEDLPGIYEQWTEALRSGQVYHAEYRLRFADGNYRWHLGRAVPMIENGVVTMWLGTNTDIDLQKENEKRKDEFLSIASHELKTPLTSIKSFNQLMNRVRDGQQLGLYIQKSYNNILRLERLINDLLDVTKINAGKMIYDMQPFDFLQMVRETIENVQLTVNTHEIILNSCEPFEFTGDRMRLEQVLINLLDNAIKYSPGGEEVLVRVGLEEGNVIVAVQDYGVGIEKSHLLRLFDRYYRSDNTAMRFEGLGLGLFISAEIVKRHHGSYWLESEPAKGSTFYFRLPLEVNRAIKPIVDEHKFYQDHHVTIQYNSTLHQIESRWRGYQSFASVQRGGLKILELLQYNRVKKLLNDNTEVMGNWSEAAEWVAKDLMTSLEAAGLKYFAWVQSRSAFSRLSAQKAADMSSVGFDMAFFNDRTAAEAWLADKTV
jgi:two-component system CheB/CheR fusion protein